MRQHSLVIFLLCVLAFMTATAVQADTPYTKVSLSRPAEQSTAISSTSGKININQASSASLSVTLKGVGMKKAAAIVRYRQQHGKFKNIEALKNVPGIGNKILNANLGRISVN